MRSTFTYTERDSGGEKEREGEEGEEGESEKIEGMGDTELLV